MPSPPPSLQSPGPRAVCTWAGALCPVLLLGLYGGLSSNAGARFYDRFALRNYGSGLVAFGVLILLVGGILLAGMALGIGAVVRKEQPRWAARGVLVVNGLIVLAALSLML